jgi:hypothetical protein
MHLFCLLAVARPQHLGRTANNRDGFTARAEDIGGKTNLGPVLVDTLAAGRRDDPELRQKCADYIDH